jgi:hypothetical protein
VRELLNLSAFAHSRKEEQDAVSFQLLPHPFSYLNKGIDYDAVPTFIQNKSHFVELDVRFPVHDADGAGSDVKVRDY